MYRWFKKKMIRHVKKKFGQINRMLITAGAGDIDTLVEPIKQILRQLTNELNLKYQEDSFGHLVRDRRRRQ